MKRLAASLGAALTVCFLFWVSGFDFDERGFFAFLCAWCSLGAGAMVYVCPLWEEE